MFPIKSSSNGLRALAAFAAVLATAAASADTLTQSFDLTPNGAERTSWSKNIDVARFNPTLGTLASIDLQLIWTGQLGGSIQNISHETNTIHFEHDLVLGLARRNGDDLGSATVASTTYDATLAVGATGKYGPVKSNGTYNFSLNGNDPFGGLFIGTGNVDLAAYALAETGQLINGPIKTDVDTFAGVQGRLTYNYAPVPEPASMATLGLGVLGLLRRRKLGGAK